MNLKKLEKLIALADSTTFEGERDVAIKMAKKLGWKPGMSINITDIDTNNSDGNTWSVDIKTLRSIFLKTFLYERYTESYLKENNLVPVDDIFIKNLIIPAVEQQISEFKDYQSIVAQSLNIIDDLKWFVNDRKNMESIRRLFDNWYYMDKSLFETFMTFAISGSGNIDSSDDRIKRFVDSAYKNYNDTKEQLYTEVNSGADDEYIRSIYDEKSLESR